MGVNCCGGNNGDERIFRNDGGGVYTLIELVATASTTVGVAWGDYDNDGDLDLAVANLSGQDEYIAVNDGMGGFSSHTLTGTGGNSRSIAWGDYDSDGDLDLLIGNDNGADSKILRNDGGGAFTATGHLSGSGGTTWGVAWVDYDGDGDLDVALSQRTSFDLWRNNSGTSFTLVQNLSIADDTLGIAGGDFDGDGDIDFAARGRPGILRNNAGTFEYTKIVGEGASQGATWGDIDGDLDLDLILTGVNDELFIARNDVQATLSARPRLRRVFRRRLRKTAFSSAREF